MEIIATIAIYGFSILVAIVFIYVIIRAAIEYEHQRGVRYLRHIHDDEEEPIEYYDTLADMCKAIVEEKMNDIPEEVRKAVRSYLVVSGTEGKIDIEEGEDEDE